MIWGNYFSWSLLDNYVEIMIDVIVDFGWFWWLPATNLWSQLDLQIGHKDSATRQGRGPPIADRLDMRTPENVRCVLRGFYLGRHPMDDTLR